MLLDPLLGLSLVLSASLSNQTLPPIAEPVTWHQLSLPQKQATLLPLVQSATACIYKAVSSNARYAGADAAEINNLIVASMPSCAPLLRRMVETHDILYGNGSGKAFLLGPYLDVLPSALVRPVRAPTR